MQRACRRPRFARRSRSRPSRGRCQARDPRSRPRRHGSDPVTPTLVRWSRRARCRAPANGRSRPRTPSPRTTSSSPTAPLLRSADEPVAVRELDHRAHDVEPRRACHPADLRAPREVDVARTVAQRRGDCGVADAGPQVRRIRRFAVRDALRRRVLVVARELDARRAAPVARDGARWGIRAIAGDARRIGIIELELERGIRDGRRRHAALGDEIGAGIGGRRDLPPFLAEEQRRERRRPRRCSCACGALLRADQRREQRECRADRKSRPTGNA